MLEGRPCRFQRHGRRRRRERAQRVVEGGEGGEEGLGSGWKGRQGGRHASLLLRWRGGRLGCRLFLHFSSVCRGEGRNKPEEKSSSCYCVCGIARLLAAVDRLSFLFLSPFSFSVASPQGKWCRQQEEQDSGQTRFLLYAVLGSRSEVIVDAGFSLYRRSQEKLGTS